MIEVEKKQIALLILLMAAVSMVTGLLAIYLSYQTAFDVEERRLMELAESRARMMEAVDRFNQVQASSYPGGARAATLAQVREAHENFPGFGETGEYVLAEKGQGQIVFLLSHRHNDLEIPDPIPMVAHLAEPMRRALSGRSGIVVGPDYRGQPVLAAHEHVEKLGFGLVVKIDLSEVRAPYIAAAIKISWVSAILIALSALLFLKISEPIIRKMAVLARFPGDNPNPVIRVSATGEVLYSNPPGDKLLARLTTEETTSDPTARRLPASILTRIERVVDTGVAKEFEQSVGKETWHFLISVVNGSGSIYLYGSDITERVKWINELLLNKAIFENATEGVMVCDAGARIQMANPAFTEITGYPLEEVQGKNPRLLQSGRHDKPFYKAMWAEILKHGEWKGEIYNRRKSGEVFPQEMSIKAIVDDRGVIVWYASLFRDITERKRVENLLKSQSTTDELTGIANRRTFNQRIEEEWNRVMRSRKPCAVIMIDIDHFKLYNDRYGHPQGDTCLKEVACALAGCLKRSTDLLARYGGEEFIVILPMTPAAGAREFAEAMCEAVQRLELPHDTSPTASCVTISAGVGVVHAKEGMESARVVELADEALYQAKHAGRNRVFLKELDSPDR